MSTPTKPNVVDAWLTASTRNRDTDRFRVSLAAFRAIGDGRLVRPEELTAESGLSPEAVERTVSALADEGRLIRDGDGRVTGAGGLSLARARHGLRMFGRDYWVWCGLDAVGIPAGLDADARVDSVCEDTGDAVVIEIRAGRPVAVSPTPLWISLFAPTLDRPLYDSCCSKIRFYADRASVPADAVAVDIAEAAALGRRLWGDGIPL